MMRTLFLALVHKVYVVDEINMEKFLEMREPKVDGKCLL